MGALLDSGADPHVRTSKGYCIPCLLAFQGNARSIDLWAQRFPNWNYSRGATGANLTPLCFAAGFGGGDKMAVIDALVRAGADPTACTAHTGTTIIHNVCANIDADYELVRFVLALPGVRGLADTPMQAVRLKWKCIFKIVRLFVSLGAKRRILKILNNWPGQTPLMSASIHSNTVAIKAMVEVGNADVTLRNKSGLTAFDQLHGDSLPEIGALLRVD